MPEVISKHPEITIRVLQGAGARCGEGAPQRILTRCPAERFCSTPTGEICVYGLDQIPQMTQISPAELARAISEARTQEPGRDPAPPPPPPQTVFSTELFFLILAALVIGAVLGTVMPDRLRGRNPR